MGKIEKYMVLDCTEQLSATKLHKFLWFRWQTRQYDRHDWAYTDREHRVCKKCTKKEVLFNTRNIHNITYEDWRDNG